MGKPLGFKSYEYLIIRVLKLGVVMGNDVFMCLIVSKILVTALILSHEKRQTLERSNRNSP